MSWKGGGGFRFYTLGDAVFLADGSIKSPLLGAYEGSAYYLLYNGILGDKRPQGGNVLTQAVLAELDNIAGAKHAREGKRVIYGEKTNLSERRLAAENIVFKQIPYEIKAR